MSKEQYDLVFKGELAKGIELEQARRNLGALFKLDGPKLNALFSGKSITIKKKLDFETASKYRIAIKKAGALVEVVEVKQAAPVVAKGKAVFSVDDTSPESFEEDKTIPSKSSLEKSNKNQTKASTEYDSSGSLLSLAPVGADILSSQEQSHEPVVNIDISNLSLKIAEGPLVEESERKKDKAQPIAVDDSINLLDTEGYLVDESEHQSLEPVDVDVSSISMAEPGVRLVEAKEETFAEIDISELRIESY